MFSPDRHVSFNLCAAIAWLLWIKVVADVVIAGVTGDLWWGICGLACAAAAGTLHIRSFFGMFSTRMRSMFDLGVEEERQRVQRDLHSV